ncbi:ankyrin repeat domain-containing protein [Novilysobacter spongiicola]|uniref:ankyrin repeat domain-containing protein n=1 Tax=Novilysobacter spongiicola TaxID=435289 RepID=UPI003CCE1EDC
MRSKTGEPSTPLIEATKHSLSILLLLLQSEWDPRQQDAQGFAALHYANNVRTVKALIEAGADPNVRSLRGITPLHCCQDPAGCAELLDAGADPWAITDEGVFPWQALRQNARLWGRAAQDEAAPISCLKAADLVESTARFASMSLQTTPIPPTNSPLTRRF